MAEISLAKQLSGTESLESLLVEIRRKLNMNGRFAPHMSYPGFRAEISIRFYPSASFIPAIEQDIEIDTVPAGAIVSESPTVDVSIDLPVRPPNQVREDSGMPTPILTQDANGNPVEKWVHRKGKVPKNSVKGGETDVITMVPKATPVEV